MITKSRLNELALEVANKHFYPGMVPEGINYVWYAHALIKRIEQEVGVVGELVDSGFRQIDWIKKPPVGTKLITLPLVSDSDE